MRDPKRIDRIVNLIGVYWKGYCSRLNFAELYQNLFGYGMNFYLEDSEIERYLEKITCTPLAMIENSMIDLTLFKFKSIWEAFPDWRFTQLFSNIFGEPYDMNCSEIEPQKFIDKMDMVIKYGF